MKIKLEDLAVECRKFLALVDDPQTGMISWNMFMDERLEAMGRLLRQAGYPKYEFPDDTLITDLPISTRAQNFALEAGWRTAGDIRRLSDRAILNASHLGEVSLKELRTVTLRIGNP
jgi:DNA-directed RNA polymerase alpha subunit